jgi:hypothetical protein
VRDLDEADVLSTSAPSRRMVGKAMAPLFTNARAVFGTERFTGVTVKRTARRTTDG